MLADADGFGVMGGAGLCFAECRSLSNFDTQFHHAMLPFGGGGFSGYAPFRRPQLVDMWMCDVTVSGIWQSEWRVYVSLDIS